MKVLNKIIKEAKYYAVPEEDDLEGQSEAILNMPAVQPVDVDIDDELDMIDDIETRAGNLGSVYGDEEVGLDDEDVPCEDCEDGEVYEITSTDPVCPCCGCKLVISDLPAESEEEVLDDEDEVLDDEDVDDDEVEVLDDEDEDDEDEDDEVEVLDDEDEGDEDEDDEVEVLDDEDEDEK